MQEQGGLGERRLEYASRIIKLLEALPKTRVGNRIGDQLLRSGIAVGANYEDAQAAESKNDFIHKLPIALKEMRESNSGDHRLDKVIGAGPSFQEAWA